MTQPEPSDVLFPTLYEDDPSPPGPPSETDIWAAARALYLDDVPGADVCEALGIPPSTFWDRAAKEGWLRRDQPSTPPDTNPRPTRSVKPSLDVETALDLAWSRLCEALEAGHASLAARWSRTHAQMKASSLTERRAFAADERREARQRALDERRAAHERGMDTLHASKAIRQAAEAELALVKARVKAGHAALESLESNSRDSNASSAPPPDRPLNRAERRRLKRSGRLPAPDP